MAAQSLGNPSNEEAMPSRSPLHEDPDPYWWEAAMQGPLPTLLLHADLEVNFNMQEVPVEVVPELDKQGEAIVGDVDLVIIDRHKDDLNGYCESRYKGYSKGSGGDEYGDEEELAAIENMLWSPHVSLYAIIRTERRATASEAARTAKSCQTNPTPCNTDRGGRRLPRAGAWRRERLLRAQRAIGRCFGELGRCMERRGCQAW